MGVYLVHAQGTKLLKIGFTSKPSAKGRLRELQTGCPFKLQILSWQRTGTTMDEAGLHAFFAARRIEGEWFRAGTFVVDFKRTFDMWWKLSEEEKWQAAVSSPVAEERVAWEMFL